jgi:hypothetical protein
MKSLFLALTALGVAACSSSPGSSDVTTSAASAADGANPTPPVGDFRPTSAGNVQAMARLTVDIIDMRQSDAQEHLASLRAAGAACQAEPADQWRCSLMHAASEVPAASLAKIGTRNQGLYATFEAPIGKPALTSQGDSLVEWAIPQSGTSSVGPFDSYRYLQMEGDMTKLILPAPRGDDGLELILQDASHLAKWDSITVTESRWRFHEDMALVVLEKQ